MTNTNVPKTRKVTTIRCMQCMTPLRSLYRHDFQMCPCPNKAYIDGGTDYCRMGAMDPLKVEVVKEKL